MPKKRHKTVTWVKPRYSVYLNEEDGAHPLVVKMNAHAKAWHELNSELEAERKLSAAPSERYSMQCKWGGDTDFFLILRCSNVDEFEAYRRRWTVSPKPNQTVHSCRYFVKSNGSIVQSLKRGYKVLDTPLEPTSDEMERFEATGEVPRRWLASWIMPKLEEHYAENNTQPENEVGTSVRNSG